MSGRDANQLAPDLPKRILVDGTGFVWRDFGEGYLSMCPGNPDNEPLPEPITAYVPENSGAGSCAAVVDGADKPDRAAGGHHEMVGERQGRQPAPERDGNQLGQGSVGGFEAELREQRPYFTEVTFEWEDPPIAIVRTKPGYLFDDAFWDIFHHHQLHVCHVAYYGPERREGRTHDEVMADEGVYELRFITREQAIEAGRLQAVNRELVKTLRLADALADTYGRILAKDAKFYAYQDARSRTWCRTCGNGERPCVGDYSCGAS